MNNGKSWGTFVLAGALALLTLLVCMTRYADYDLWWHLKLGELIRTNGRLPGSDTFSYTAAGRHQFTGEWLADLLIYLTYAGGGFLGLNLLKAGLLLVTFRFLYLQMLACSPKTRGTVTAAIITLVLVLFAVRFRLFVRPYLFSLPLLAACLHLLGKRHDGGRGIWLLPLLMLLWANMSVGAVFGLFALGVAAVVDLVQRRSMRLLPVLLLTVAASLANPETYRLYTLSLDLTSDPYRTLVGEYQPITREILFGSGLRYTLCFQLLAAGSLLYFLLLRGWKNLFQLILFAFLLYESFRQVRLVELCSLVAAPCFFALLAHLFSRLPQLPERVQPLLPYALAAGMVALIPATVLNSPVYAFGVGPKEAAFPDGALRFLDREGIRGRMFNSYGFGGYVIWAGGGRQVFIDGRYRRVYTPAEYGEYKGIMESAAAWGEAEKKYGFDYAILEYDLLSRRFPEHLLTNPDWALVYWDNQSLVFVKRTPERAGLIASWEYRVAKPHFLDMGYLDQYSQGGKIQEVLPLLDREVALNPDNQFVVLARIYLRYQLGKLYLAQIRDDLERILPMKPDFAMKHSALAMVLAENGETERARRELFRALRLDPLDAAAIALAKRLGIAVKIPKNAIPGHP
jgi:tetratricopeptide (TPR) repeat protein